MKENIKDKLLKLYIYLTASIVVLVATSILIFIFKKGISSISIDFLLDRPKGLPLGVEGGIFPAITGSLLLMTMAAFFSSILSITTAIYLVFYCNNPRIKSYFKLIIQCISGVPSIILGLFGYSLLVLRLGFGRSLLSGSITLAIMIFPYIEVKTEKIFMEIDENIIMSSYSLGIPKYYTIMKLILPIYGFEIISSILLASGLALGASAPIILTAAVLMADSPKSIFSPVMALPFHLYILINEGMSLENAYGTALVLILILLLINLISTMIFKIKGRK